MTKCARVESRFEVVYAFADEGQVGPFIILAGCLDGVPDGMGPAAFVLRFLGRLLGLGIEIGGIDVQAAGIDERLGCLSPADARDERTLFPDSRCQTGEVAVAGYNNMLQATYYCRCCGTKYVAVVSVSVAN